MYSNIYTPNHLKVETTTKTANILIKIYIDFLFRCLCGCLLNCRRRLVDEKKRIPDTPRNINEEYRPVNKYIILLNVVKIFNSFRLIKRDTIVTNRGLK